jgi:hypothetical protein
LLKYRLISAFVLIPVVIAALFLLPPMGFCYRHPGGLYARRVGVGATERFHLNVAAGLAGGAVRPSAGGDAFPAAGIPL